MFLNRCYNCHRERFGYGYWSLAGFLKHHIRRAKIYIEEYEHGVAYACKKQGFDGVICGHIHQAASKKIDGIDYYNTGDWVESCTALGEDEHGHIHLIHWPVKRPQKSSNDDGDNGIATQAQHRQQDSLDELDDLEEIAIAATIEENIGVSFGDNKERQAHAVHSTKYRHRLFQAKWVCVFIALFV